MSQNVLALIDQAEASLFRSIHLTPAHVLHCIQLKYSMTYGFAPKYNKNFIPSHQPPVMHFR